MKTPLLQLKNISKSFPGVQALTRVSFDLHQGEIMALIGANGAGKSTLMNILGGVIQKDGGEILINGDGIQMRNPGDAKKNGIAFVHQELTILPKLSILDNLLISSFPQKYGFIEQGRAKQMARSVLEKVGCNLDLNMRIMDIGPGDQQQIEIARILLLDPQIVIFDEPTSSLSKVEKDRLFALIKQLKSKNVSVIYITHLLEEVFSIAEKVAILRNGELVSEGPLKNYTREKIIKFMTGIESQVLHKKKSKENEPCLLEVSELSSRGLLKDINFKLYQGEILGLWGLLGSGRTELVRAIVGLDPIDTGTIKIKVKNDLQVVDSQKTNKWIGLISEDRRNEGLFSSMPVKVNMTIANLKAFIGKIWPFLNLKAEDKSSREYVQKLHIKLSSLEQRIETLSGGNQQKVIISRWLQRNPIIYFMDEPIKGIDVGAKVEIKNLILELAENGAGVLLISSEIDELMSICDRYLVMCRGQITGEFQSNVSKEKLIGAATNLQSN
jgi:ABC-type sugar transport system ATPase subunit